jgi:hypothetical protein
MTERNRLTPKTTESSRDRDPREARLEALLGAANPVRDPAIDPPAELRQRVAELARASDTRSARPGPWWRLAAGWPQAALATAAVAILMGLLLGRWDPGRLPRTGRPELVRQMAPPPSLTRSRRLPQPLQNNPGAQIARSTSTRPDVSYPRRVSSPRPLARGSRNGSLAHPAPNAGPRLAAGSRKDAVHGTGGPAERARPGATTSPDEWEALAARVRRTLPVRDDFVRVPFPRLVDTSDRQIVAAVDSYKREAAIVDARLAREVTAQQKGTALGDLCERLRSETGIRLEVGQSVADEKVTLFCRNTSLRDVMRQLSRPFGYTWLRSGKAGEYRYELVQDLRSQLLEEELRNRDRNAALLALDREVERYRPYLGLSPDEALARSKTAPPTQKKLLERIAGQGWAGLQLYFRLSRQEMLALRSDQELWYHSVPGPGQQALPSAVARGALESLRDYRMLKFEGGHFGFTTDLTAPGALPLAAIPELRVNVALKLSQSELGQLALRGGTGFAVYSTLSLPDTSTFGWADLAVGMSPAVQDPDNGAANAKLARDLSLRPRISIQPQASCPPATRAPAAPDPTTATESAPEPKVTSADVLEAVHHATGLPIVSDYYTRLHKPEAVSSPNQPLFDALNRVADAMRMRWNKDGSWLQFRSASYYDDRLKEVPNRLLARWTASRRQHGVLTLDDFCEIAQLPDAQLDAEEMAKGASACFGLVEWDMARGLLRQHLRFLAQLTPAQRQEAMSDRGLVFPRMTLAQQQRFISLAIDSDDEPLQSLEELEGATLRVEYTLPGWFTWRVPGLESLPGRDWLQWVVPLGLGWHGQRAPRPQVRERTREAALAAARRIAPQLSQEVVDAMRQFDPRHEAVPIVPDESQIVPTKRDLTVIYIPGATNKRPIQYISPSTWITNGTLVSIPTDDR